MTAGKLTNVQARYLRAIASGDDPYLEIHGRAAHGGAAMTEKALRRKGFLSGQLGITDAGRAALAEMSRASAHELTTKDGKKDE